MGKAKDCAARQEQSGFPVCLERVKRGFPGEKYFLSVFKEAILFIDRKDATDMRVVVSMRTGEKRLLL